MEQAIADGVLCKADSYEALAAFIGCDEGKTSESVYGGIQRLLQGRKRRLVLPRIKCYMLSMEEGALIMPLRPGEDMLITHGGIRVQ